MTYNLCFAYGSANFLPDDRDYVQCADLEEVREEIRRRVEDFNEEHRGAYNYAPDDLTWRCLDRHGAGMLNWRLCVARDVDFVLDVIGMTDAEFALETDC